MPTQRKHRKQTFNNDAPTGPDDKIWDVIDAGPCLQHEKLKIVGEPCFAVQGLTGTSILGICNKRAIHAGFNHPISAEAMRGRVQPKY